MVEMKVVCVSRKRADSCENTVRTMPIDLVCVAEGERADYRTALDASPDERVRNTPIVTHPDSVVGGCAVFGWVTKNIKTQCVVCCDDDITRVICMVGRRPRRIRDVRAIRQILQNAAEITYGMGARMFTFALTDSVLDFMSSDPFQLAKGGGPCKGYFGGDGEFDPSLRYHGDGDHLLTCLLRDRYVFKDTRFRIASQMHTNPGGSADLFSKEAFDRDCAYLKKKWGGKYFYFKDTGRLGLHGFPIYYMITTVQRRQPLVV